MNIPAVGPDRLDVLEMLLRRGGETLLQCLDRGRALTRKRGADDIVTEADYASERVILDALAEVAPRDGVLSEEAGFRAGESAYTWVVDPLDGTVNFATGLDDYGVIIGLTEDGVPVAGGMYLPAKGLIYLGSRGGGAYRNGVQIHGSAATELGEAVFDHSLSSIATDPTLQEHSLRTLIRSARGVRCSHCLSYLARVAEGVYDGFVYHSVGIWDICGPSVILAEAGVQMAQLDGRPLDLAPSPENAKRIYAVMAANPTLLAALRAELDRA